MDDHDRIVTPDTDPERWTEVEIALFRKGLCSWQVEYGNWGPPKYCEAPSAPGASFGHCKPHDAKMLEDHFPDGTYRPGR